MERMTRWNPETEEAECEIDGVVHTGSITTRLAEYEDTGLEPEQCAKYAQAEKEGRYIVLKEPRSTGVHRLEEIARADIEGRLVKATWKRIDYKPCGHDYKCSSCGWKNDMKTRFCPNCGAEMSENKNDQSKEGG